MKKITVAFIIVLSFSYSSQCQDQLSDDLSSLDNIIAALYDVLSGDKGVARDWDRMRNLFIPEARLIPSRKGEDGSVGYRIMSPDDYIKSSGKWLEENGFHEIEIHRLVEEYGSLVHIWSTYESYHTKADENPFARGINSIQLLNNDGVWQIVQIYWLGESEMLKLPKKYLP